jgi:hypothetical protein
MKRKGGGDENKVKGCERKGFNGTMTREGTNI